MTIGRRTWLRAKIKASKTSKASLQENHTLTAMKKALSNTKLVNYTTRVYAHKTKSMVSI